MQSLFQELGAWEGGLSFIQLLWAKLSVCAISYQLINLYNSHLRNRVLYSHSNQGLLNPIKPAIASTNLLTDFLCRLIEETCTHFRP